MHTVLLVFDIGSSGLKASLMDEDLNILRNVTTTYPTRRRAGGVVEQDAADWWMSAVRAMLMLRELVPEYVKRVDAVGICGHMWGCLPMDRDGQPLQRAMIYSDRRAAKWAETLQERFGSDYFYRETGNMLIAQNTLCKSVWLRHEQPELYEQTYKILQAKDYLVYRLTGNLDSTDLSDASYGALVSLSRRAYDRDFFRAVDLDPDKFPTVHTGCEIAGHLTEEAAGHLGLRAGIPVSVGGGTSACANVGGGTAKNVIPEEVTFGGSVRCQSPESRGKIEAMMNRMIGSIVAGYNCTHRLDYTYGVPPLVNDVEVTKKMRAAAAKLLGEEHVRTMEEPRMGSEDYACYCEKVKASCFARLGIWKDGMPQPKFHNGDFCFDDNALPVGAGFFVQAVLELNGR